MTLPRKLAAAALGAALGLGTLAGAASAQTSTTVARAKPAKPTAAERQAAQDQRLSELAGRLGVTKDRLVQALKEQRKAEVDRAVAAGRLTAARAAELKAAIDRGDVGGGIGKGGFGHGGRGGGRGGRGFHR